jgi:hypothetical protein
MSNQVGKVCVLVILYGKELAKSHTLSSLLNFDCSHFDLTVLNNGPQALPEGGLFYDKLSSGFNNFELLNKIENMPLSIAYNSFIDNHPDADKYVFLDDDTEITESYYTRLTDGDTSFDVEVPKIVSSDDALNKGIVHYPVENDVPVLEKRAVDVNSVLSIGSGLIISRAFVMKFQSVNLPIFDNRYALYGVDYSLFRNMRKLLKEKMQFTFTSFSSLNHSLSRLQKGALSEHTKRERLYDVILSARHHPNRVYVTGLIKAILRETKNFNLPLVLHIISTFAKGYHPRCERYIVNRKK